MLNSIRYNQPHSKQNVIEQRKQQEILRKLQISPCYQRICQYFGKHDALLSSVQPAQGYNTSLMFPYLPAYIIKIKV